MTDLNNNSTTEAPTEVATGVENIKLDDPAVDGGNTEKPDENPAVTPRTTETEDNDSSSGEMSSTTASEEEDEAAADDDAGISNTEQAEKFLIEATSLKEMGNEHFKKGELEEAAISYRRGVNKIKNLNKNNTGDEQVKALLLTLHTNFSMVRFKQEQYKISAELAGKAVNIDRKNVKALYRRALAYRQMGNLDAARTDLRAALQVDANNTACRKELAQIKKQIEQSNENQKKALAKAFSGKSSLLYDDKEKEEKRKQEEAERKRKAEQELYRQRKQQWEDECVKKMAQNEEVESFEDWEKRLKKEEEEKKKAEEAKRKEEEKKRKEAQRQARKAARQNKKDDSDSDDELTEQELAMMRGYKKTADGRTTSYFTRELSEEEKTRLGDIAPKRLETEGSSPVPLSEEQLKNSQPGPSAWNQAGTWEEKDTTEWCKEQLKKRLHETSFVGDKIDVDITKVDDLTGEASVAMAGGKKRYIFDFHVKLKYEIKHSDTGVVASGVVRIPDICSTSHDEIEINFESWKKRPSQEYLSDAMKARESLVDELRKNVQVWVQDFNNQY